MVWSKNKYNIKFWLIWNYLQPLFSLHLKFALIEWFLISCPLPTSTPSPRCTLASLLSLLICAPSSSCHRPCHLPSCSSHLLYLALALTLPHLCCIVLSCTASPIAVWPVVLLLLCIWHKKREREKVFASLKYTHFINIQSNNTLI